MNVFRLLPTVIAAAAMVPAGISRGEEALQKYGYASFYLKGHAGYTASGEAYREDGFTGAHASLPFGSWVRVTHMKTGDYVDVRINDRNPFQSGHVIDLSYAAAKHLGITRQSAAEVLVSPLKVVPATAAVSVATGSSGQARQDLALRPVSGLGPEVSRGGLFQGERPEDGASLNHGVLRVQFGAFQWVEHAEEAQRILGQRGVATSVVRDPRPNHLPFRLISTGVFHEADSATRWLQALKRQMGDHFGDAFVTR